MCKWFFKEVLPGEACKEWAGGREGKSQAGAWSGDEAENFKQFQFPEGSVSPIQFCMKNSGVKYYFLIVLSQGKGDGLSYSNPCSHWQCPYDA